MINRNLFISLAITVFTLCICELALRKVLHYRPGVHTTFNWFHEVDSLVTLKGFMADSDGIYKIDPEAATYINNAVTKYTTRTFPSADSAFLIHGVANGISSDLYGQCFDYLYLKDTNYHSPFADYLQRIKNDTTEDEINAAIVNYSNAPINADGFRSIAFKQYHTKKKKILVLGDSFAYGNGTTNFTNCFADLLLAKGYVVYNSAITGTDPEQYRAIAKKYIPVLHPDVVLFNLSTASDMGYCERPVRPLARVSFPTNAGNLVACPQGIYFNTAESIYNFIVEQSRIPEQGAFNTICSKTCITTLVWKALEKNGWVNKNTPAMENYNKAVAQIAEPAPVCTRIVADIKTVAEKNEARFIYVQVPELTTAGLKYPKDYKGFSDTIPHFYPPVDATGYKEPGGHFNDKGHKLYAEYLQKLIEGDN